MRSRDLVIQELLQRTTFEELGFEYPVAPTVAVEQTEVAAAEAPAAEEVPAEAEAAVEEVVAEEAAAPAEETQ